MTRCGDPESARPGEKGAGSKVRRYADADADQA